MSNAECESERSNRNVTANNQLNGPDGGERQQRQRAARLGQAGLGRLPGPWKPTAVWAAGFHPVWGRLVGCKGGYVGGRTLATRKRIINNASK